MKLCCLTTSAQILRPLKIGGSGWYKKEKQSLFIARQENIFYTFILRIFYGDNYSVNAFNSDISCRIPSHNSRKVRLQVEQNRVGTFLLWCMKFVKLLNRREKANN